jgi:hypothetical protein
MAHNEAVVGNLWHIRLNFYHRFYRVRTELLTDHFTRSLLMVLPLPYEDEWCPIVRVWVLVLDRQLSGAQRLCWSSAFP